MTIKGAAIKVGEVAIITVIVMITFVTRAAAQVAVDVCYADVNQDFKVDIDDYSLLARSILKPIADTRVDLDEDWLIDLTDYGLFVSQFLRGFTGCQNTVSTYYVSPQGKDTNTGTASQPFATITKAITTIRTNNQTEAIVYLQPGTYRQRTDIIGLNGSAVKPITITAVQKGTATISGGESSKSVTWTKGTGGLAFPSASSGQVYYADVTAWGAAPQIATYTNANGDVIRLPIAKEPDVDIYAPTTTTDGRWTAEKVNTSQPNRSLVATTANPAGASSGNLQNINGFNTSFLTGAAIFVKDTHSAHDEYRANITSHNPATGEIILDADLKYYTGAPLIGPNSKYYIEGKSQLLDVPGEWIFDAATKRIYIWPPNNVSPATLDIEFAVRPVGIMVRNSNNITIRNLNFTAINYKYTRNFDDEGAVLLSNKDVDASTNIVVDGVKITHSGVGVRVTQGTAQKKLTQGFRLKNSEVGYTDGVAFNTFQWPNKDANNNTISGVKGIFLQNNEFHHSAYRPGATMVWMQQAQNIVMQNNYIHDSPHNGVEIQGGQETNLLVQNNLFSHNCLIGTDCGGFKLWASGTSMHNVLVMGNIAETTQGCSHAARVGGDYVSSNGDGCGGFGFYTDIVKSSTAGDPAVTFFRNLAYDNNFSGFHITRGQDHLFAQNIGYNNPAGIRINIGSGATEKFANSKIISNLWVNTNNAAPRTVTQFGTPTTLYDVGINLPMDPAERSTVKIDDNAYYASGLSSRALYTRTVNQFNTQKNYSTVAEIKNDTPWEDIGRDASLSFFPVPSGFEIGPFMQAAGISTTPPAEVQAVINKLQQQLGFTIKVNTWIGKR